MHSQATAKKKHQGNKQKCPLKGQNSRKKNTVTKYLRKLDTKRVKIPLAQKVSANFNTKRN
jgi:hypothetical protein